MGSRRPYLTRRLVSGEITLEEARELFKDMGDDLSLLESRLQQITTLPPPPSGEGPVAPSAPQRSGRDIGIEELLLFVGPAAGLFAAVLKRTRESR